jgi:hypothetical protein
MEGELGVRENKEEKRTIFWRDRMEGFSVEFQLSVTSELAVDWITEH